MRLGLLKMLRIGPQPPFTQPLDDDWEGWEREVAEGRVPVGQSYEEWLTAKAPMTTDQMADNWERENDA